MKMIDYYKDKFMIWQFTTEEKLSVLWQALLLAQF